MKSRTMLSVVVLLLATLVALPLPMAAQEPDAALSMKELSEPQIPQAPEAASASEVGWQYGPPSDFEYQRFDAVFVPGPEAEPWANRVYFLGGRISAPAEKPDIWVFDPVTGVYTDTLVDMIEDVSNYNSNLVMDDGTGRGPAVYVVGGTDKDGGSGGGNLGLVQRYYPQSGTIEALPGADDWPGQVAGQTVGGMGSVVINDIIYVFGGWQTGVGPEFFSSATWTFDPKQLSGSRWTDLGTPMNIGRSYIQSAVQNGKIYAMGGIFFYDGSDLVPTMAVEVLDTSNLAAGWTFVSSLPIPLAEGRGFGFEDDTLGTDAPWDGLLFIAGGGDWPDITREAMKYDIASNTWDQSFPDLNDRRVNNAGTFIPLCTPDPNDGLPGLWVFGGRSENGCDPPYGATEFYPLPCADCVPLTGATITGTKQLLIEETGAYTVTLEPPSATEPINIEWSNGMTGTSAVYGWGEPGFHTVDVTGTNCSGLAMVNASFEVEVKCIELTGAPISGPQELLVGETGTFTTTLEPPTATLPIDVLWSNGTTSTTAVYSWTVPGDYTVAVTGTNCLGTAVVTNTLDVAVAEPVLYHYLYLPIIVRNG